LRAGIEGKKITNPTSTRPTAAALNSVGCIGSESRAPPRVIVSIGAGGIGMRRGVAGRGAGFGTGAAAARADGSTAVIGTSCVRLSACTRSAADWKRRPGSFARAFINTSDNVCAMGRSARTWRGGRGGVWMWCSIIAIGVSEWNGSSPVSIS
jgi:hypothetical protein